MAVSNRTIHRTCRLIASVCLLLPFLRSSLQAQTIQTSIANEFRYGIGEQYEQETPFRKEYLEDLFSTRIYTGDFELGFRIQIDKPREYGRDTLGLKEYYAEFRRDNLRARAGTFYNLVGRGLVFNTFESRPLGFDTQTEGAKLQFATKEFEAEAYGGILKYADILSTTRVEEYLVRGFDGKVRPIREIGVGGSFLAATGRPTRQGFFTPFDAYLREGFVEANYQGARLYFNYADKRTPLDSAQLAATSSDGYGFGWYGLLSYAAGMFNVTAEFKDYRFDLVSPSDIQNSTRITRALPFQYPPTLIFEHDKTLLARNPHAIDYNDELGFKVEGLVYPTDDLTLTLLALAGSRHRAWNVDFVDNGSGETEAEFSPVDGKTLSFPELSNPAYSPYWEAFVQADYELNENVSLAVALQQRDNKLFYEPLSEGIPEKIEDYRASTLMLEALTGFGVTDNLHTIVELQSVYDSKKKTPGNDTLGIAPYDGKFNNVLLTLEFTHSPTWSINTRLEWTTTDKEQGGRRLWPVVGGTYRWGAHTFGLQYGAERGGVVCTGGVCRLINPFDGFRLSVSSKL